jgi:hypothetical protein
MLYAGRFFVLRALGQPYSLASFGLSDGIERLANVYGCEVMALVK